MPQDAMANFGGLLRQFRRAAGLTQFDLAERAGLSVHGVQKLEQGVTHPYRDTAQRLAAALDLSPENEGRFRAAVQPVRRHRPRRASAPNVHQNLPTLLSSFVGRDQELADIVARLEGMRLLTLTGVGGCGKTRLAIEVARAILPKYPDGVWLIELGPLSDPKLVAQQVGAVLGIRENPGLPLTTALIRALSGRRMLLVLDNCEHLLQACAELLSSLLHGCPELYILATSREPLGIDGEIVWRVPSLEVHDPERAATLFDLERTPAVRLFMDRARAAQPHFELNERTGRAVTEICRRLDGIPLALELAAARVQALTAEQLAQRLDQRFRLLTGGSRTALPRHQTLEATLDWSYDLLSRPERRLFERLSVFAGGWTLEAVEAIAAGPGVSQDDVLDLLASLVRKSLVVVSDAADGTLRYELLETVRDYARQKLLARGTAETTATWQRHAGYYSEFAEQLCSPLRVRRVFAEGGPAAAELRDRIDEVHDNLRSALGWWAETARPAEGLRLAVTLSEFWMWRGMYTETRRWLDRMLDLANSTPPAAAASGWIDIRMKAMINVGVLATWQGEYVQACGVLQAAVAIADRVADATLHAFALAVLGMSLWLAGDPERSTSVLDECLRLSLESGSLDRIAHAYRHLGMAARWQGQYERADDLLDRSVAAALQETPHSGHSFARSLSNSARVAFLLGNHDRAWSALRQAFEVIRDSQLEGQSLSESLDWLAALENARGEPERAARLFGAAEAQWEASGSRRYAPDQSGYQGDVASVRAQLDGGEFAAAWTGGRAMNPQQAIAYALEETRPDLTATARRADQTQASGLG